ncbi:MAG: hypothetical protein K0Q60_4202 [Microvirga sp.]|jgi:hypothetical protein|nr:hypothetical protein [Microvirga sp.]
MSETPQGIGESKAMEVMAALVTPPQPNGILRAEYILKCPMITQMWGCSKLITPELAREILEWASTQRPLRPRAVKRLMRDLKKGEFALTHQGLAFDENGVLLDGQHRLQAIVQSGEAVELFCCFNVPRASFRKIDRNERRSVADDFVQLGIAGDRRTALTMSAAARIIDTFDAGNNPAAEDYQASTEEIEETVYAHPLLEETVRWVLTHRSTVNIPPAPFAAFLTLFREVDNTTAMGFAERFVGGDKEYPEDPAFLLFSGQIHSDSKRKVGRSGFMFRIVRAWNQLRSGERRSKLFSGEVRGGGFPEISGYTRKG